MTTDSQKQPNEESKASETPKLYAGKFNSVEELENGYKNSAKIFEENARLKTDLENASKANQVPDEYLIPSDVQLDEARVAELKARAKDAGMTQTQYERLLKSDKARIDTHKADFEKARRDLGEEKVNLLSDYAKKTCPPELVDEMVAKYIADPKAREAAFRHREWLLNNRVPGMDKTSAGGQYQVSDDDIKKAYAAKEKSPGDLKARQRYMNLLAQQAHQGK